MASLNFHYVRELTKKHFENAGVEINVHEVQTLPTASIRKRAKALDETIKESADDEGDIFLVGHSTGGLDARLFTTPDVALEAIS